MKVRIQIHWILKLDIIALGDGREQSPEVIRKSINGGANPNSEDPYGRPSLHIAVVQCNSYAIDALIAAMADG